MEHEASIADIAFFLQKFAAGKNVKILDLGCGDGKKVVDILDGPVFSGANYVGLDSFYWDEKNIRPRQGKNVRYVHGNATQMPFPDGEFDLLILSHVLEHIETPEKVLVEISRVTKKDGRILVIVPLEKGGVVGFLNKHRNLYKDTRVFLKKIGIVPYNLSSPHVNFYNFKEWASLLLKAFFIEEAYARGSFSMLVFALFHPTAMLLSRHRLNIERYIQRTFPNFFKNLYRKNKNFQMVATFILCPK